MCVKYIKQYFDELGKKDKIQTKQMEKAIERSKDISEVYLHGGKAIGKAIKPKKKKK